MVAFNKHSRARRANFVCNNFTTQDTALLTGLLNGNCFYYFLHLSLNRILASAVKVHVGCVALATILQHQAIPMLLDLLSEIIPAVLLYSIGMYRFVKAHLKGTALPHQLFSVPVAAVSVVSGSVIVLENRILNRLLLARLRNA